MAREEKQRKYQRTFISDAIIHTEELRCWFYQSAAIRCARINECLNFSIQHTFRAYSFFTMNNFSRAHKIPLSTFCIEKRWKILCGTRERFHAASSLIIAAYIKSGKASPSRWIIAAEDRASLSSSSSPFQSPLKLRFIMLCGFFVKKTVEWSGERSLQKKSYLMHLIEQERERVEIASDSISSEERTEKINETRVNAFNPPLSLEHFFRFSLIFSIKTFL